MKVELTIKHGDASKTTIELNGRRYLIEKLIEAIKGVVKDEGVHLELE